MLVFIYKKIFLLKQKNIIFFWKNIIDKRIILNFLGLLGQSKSDSIYLELTQTKNNMKHMQPH